MITKREFLEILTECPWISYACKKAGLSRATIYRWMSDDEAFKKEVDEALSLGRTNIRESAEMVIMKKLEEGNLDAAKFILKRADSGVFADKTEQEKKILQLVFDSAFDRTRRTDDEVK